MSAREEIVHVVKSDRTKYAEGPERLKKGKAYQTQTLRMRFGGGFGATTTRFP
jgi:hypothetical protein